VSIEIRSARTKDIPGIRALIDTYTLGGRLLNKETVMLYEMFKNLPLLSKMML